MAGSVIQVTGTQEFEDVFLEAADTLVVTASSLGSIPNPLRVQAPLGPWALGVWVSLDGDVVVMYGTLSDQIPTLLSSVLH